MKALTALPLAAVMLFGVTSVASSQGRGASHASPMTGTAGMGNTGGTTGPAATSGSGQAHAVSSNDDTLDKPRAGIGPDASEIAAPPSIMAPPISPGRALR